MKITVLIVALSLVFGIGQKPDLKLEPGSVLPVKSVPKKNRKMYMTHSAQFRPFIERDVAGIRYVIAYDEQSRVITYISTEDKLFKSADGLRVGGYVEVNNTAVEVYPGWEIRGAEDKEGWQPLIGFDSKMTVLDGDKETILELKRYRLESEHPLKVKILGFVKGGN
jgi:hypothetical protein